MPNTLKSLKKFHTDKWPEIKKFITKNAPKIKKVLQLQLPVIKNACLEYWAVVVATAIVFALQCPKSCLIRRLHVPEILLLTFALRVLERIIKRNQANKKLKQQKQKKRQY